MARGRGNILKWQKATRTGVKPAKLTFAEKLIDLISGAGFPNDPLAFNIACEAQLGMCFSHELKKATQTGKLNAVWYHIPNSGLRSERYGNSLKMQGMLAGVPDYAFAWSDGAGFIELKFGKNSLQDKQKTFKQWIELCGINYAVCYTCDEALDTLRKWGVLI